MTHANVKRIESTIKLIIGIGLLAVLIALQGCARTQAQAEPCQPAEAASPMAVEWQEDEREAHLCGAKTQACKTCTRRVRKGEFCWQHRAKK